ncbi:hypothetical protein [Pedobacter paludis]|uniref:Tetratricopeptide repeat protein n=1 Tax=Pedobacter paludis TaxID=2203212 RepID=A0A317F0D8_9SPHI|nr:hypothetical protein [Pedobacter paludis]PWS32710.1 hypothetical protein DF947_06460 [Pedobacter paludis]
MKWLFILLFFCFIEAKAQTDLKFDKRLLDCEDKWVVIPTNQDSSYVYGFVYLDNFAGLTFKSEAIFAIKNGIYHPRKAKEFKFRISPTKDLVALVPEGKLGILNLSGNPPWLPFFKNKSQSTDRLFRLAYTYNLWGEYEKALEYLRRVDSRDMYYFGLSNQRSYAENHLIMRKLNKEGYQFPFTSERYCDYYKQTVFDKTNAGRLKEAEEIYNEALSQCPNEAYKAEMAYYILFQYYKIKNNEKFKNWAMEIDRWILPSNDLPIKVDKMKSEMAKLQTP